MGQWWVFRFPIRQDWLFQFGIAAWLVHAGYTLGDAESVSPWTFGAIAWRLPWVILAVGMVGGAPREFLRGRRERQEALDEARSEEIRAVSQTS